MSEADDERPGSIHNRMSGSIAGNSVQIGVLHGNVTWRSRGSVILIVAALVAALGLGVGVAWVMSSRDSAAVGSDQDPLSVTVEVIADMCLATWVVPKPVEQIALTTPITTYDWRAWEPTRNGFSASPANVRFTVQGRSEAQVVLTGLRVLVHERPAPPSGTTLRGQCGDSGGFRWLRVDLDAEPPRALPVFATDRVLPSAAPQWERQPIKFPYEVSLSDAETFLIEANTVKCACAWSAELTWASEGRTGTVPINDHGEWFRTSGTNGMPHCWVYTMPNLAPSC